MKTKATVTTLTALPSASLFEDSRFLSAKTARLSSRPRCSTIFDDLRVWISAAMKAMLLSFSLQCQFGLRPCYLATFGGLGFSISLHTSLGFALNEPSQLNFY